MKKKRVAVGISGGVDSAVTAALLIEQGYDVTGVFITCWNEPGCRTDQDRKDALDVALALRIPLITLDFRSAYREKVVEYFYEEYQAGRTPNPDVMCNREIKFGLFYKWALREGFDFVATGHYARIGDGGQVTSDETGRTLQLLRSVDEKKDQTYFLHLIRGEQLGHILFPIGQLTKTEVRAEAEQRGLGVARKADSVGICFVGEVSVQDFLKQLGMSEQPGRVFYRMENGTEVDAGEHRGVPFYTIGQRHGFTLDKAALKRHGVVVEQLPGVYVVEKRTKDNVLVVGGRAEAERQEFKVDSLHWISGKPENTHNLSVRIRHGGELMPATLTGVRVRLSQPAFGVAEGQAAVFYDGNVCLGGGTISG